MSIFSRLLTKYGGRLNSQQLLSSIQFSPSQRGSSAWKISVPSYSALWPDSLQSGWASLSRIFNVVAVKVYLVGFGSRITQNILVELLFEFQVLLMAAIHTLFAMYIGARLLSEAGPRSLNIILCFKLVALLSLKVMAVVFHHLYSTCNVVGCFKKQD